MGERGGGRGLAITPEPAAGLCVAAEDRGVCVVEADGRGVSSSTNSLQSGMKRLL